MVSHPPPFISGGATTAIELQTPSEVHEMWRLFTSLTHHLDVKTTLKLFSLNLWEGE